MEIIILNDGIYHLVEITKEMLVNIKIHALNVDCFDLCEIIKLKFATFSKNLNQYYMNDGSGYFYGCMCR